MTIGRLIRIAILGVLNAFGAMFALAATAAFSVPQNKDDAPGFLTGALIFFGISFVIWRFCGGYVALLSDNKKRQARIAANAAYLAATSSPSAPPIPSRPSAPHGKLDASTPSETPLHHPTHCPQCGAPWTMRQDGACLYCGEDLAEEALSQPVPAS